jgi:hypothetical protein
VRRLHAPEIEDEPWCPRVLRDGTTAFLHDVETRFGVFAGAAAVLATVLRSTGATRVVDLCSGGGGPLPALLQALDREHGLRPEAVLTDLYPNHEAFAHAERVSGGRIRGVREPVDATAVPASLSGVRTIFNGLHHLRPALARDVIVDAARQGQAFCAFEIVGRDPLTVATVAGVPLAAWALTPFSPTLSWSRALLTYALPVVPAAALWDGLCSCLRSYGDDDLDALAADVRAALADEGVLACTWRVERHPVRWLPMRLTALVVVPAGVTG